MERELFADIFRNDREAYTDGKKEFVNSIVFKALGGWWNRVAIVTAFQVAQARVFWSN